MTNQQLSHIIIILKRNQLGVWQLEKNIITLVQNTSRQFHKGITTATINKPGAIKRCGGMAPPALHLASRRATSLAPSK